MEKKSNQEKLQTLISQIGGYRELAGALQQQIGNLMAARSEMVATRDSLKGYQQTKAGTEILVPIGSGTLIKGKIASSDKVLVEIGADVVVERTPAEAVETIETRIKEIDDTIKRIQEDIVKLEEKIESIRPEAEKLMKQIESEQRAS